MFWDWYRSSIASRLNSPILRQWQLKIAPWSAWIMAILMVSLVAGRLLQKRVAKHFDRDRLNTST